MLKITSRQDVLKFEQEPIPSLPGSVYELISENAKKHKRLPALKYFLQGNEYQRNVTFTYTELLEKVHAAANMFRDLGINDSDVVTYILPNTPQTIFTVYGAQTAGIVNAVNPLLDSEHIIDIMNAAGSKILVTLAPSPQTDLWEKAVKIIPEVPSLETVLTFEIGVYFGKPSAAPPTSKTVQVLDFNETIKKYPSDKLSFNRTIKPTDIAAYFHTGGTTGRPKIAQHTHDNEIFNSWMLREQLRLEGQKSFFCGLPWFHVNGVVITGLLPLSGGHTIILGSPAGYRGEGVIANFWKIVEHYDISFFSCVPTILQMLLDVPRQGEKISSLNYALCGAAPLSVKLFNDFEKATGIKILEGYGFTEGSCANSANPPFGERKVGSIGLANSHHHMKVVILDEEKGYVRDADTDEIGILVARGRNVFPGYKESIHNKNIFINDGTHDWYNTGDLGRQDADSYFWLTGRKKELIIRGGHNIDPKSIEEPLSKHPDIAAVAAVPRPDKRVGELPVAYIQLKPNKKVSEEELLEYAKVHIKERAAIPKIITIVDEIPLTAVGKIFKPALTRLEIKDVFEKELSGIDAINKVTIEVIQHPKKGLLAEVSVLAKAGYDESSLLEDVQMALGNYTVKHELTILKNTNS